MRYDLRIPSDRDAFKKQANFLYLKGAKVELTEKRSERTLSQNSYLHLLLSYFALQYGEPMEYVKQVFFKGVVNPNYFLVRKSDPVAGEVSYLRSSATLDTREMTECIDRFKRWSLETAGIELPDANDRASLLSIRREIEAQRQWQ